MKKETDQFELLAKDALQILEIDYKESDELDHLLHKLEIAVLLPATQTEGEIARLAKEIAKEIRNKANVGSIVKLLDQLNSEFVYSKLD